MGIKEIHELNIHISRAFFMKSLSVMLNDDIMNYKSPIHFFYLVRNFNCLFEAFRMTYHADVTFSGVEKRVFQGDNKCSVANTIENTIIINYILFIYRFFV